MRSLLAGKVVRMGDAERRAVDAFTLQPAVTEDLPGFHPRKDMLDAGADLLVRAVVLLLPGGQFLARPPAVGHDDSSAGIAAISDGHGLADGSLDSDSSHALRSLRLPGSGGRPR